MLELHLYNNKTILLEYLKETPQSMKYKALKEDRALSKFNQRMRLMYQCILSVFHLSLKFIGS